VALFCSGAFIVAGVSNLIFQQFAFLPAFLTLYFVLAATGIAVRKRRRSKSNNNVVYFLNAYATESSIVTDYGITTAEVAWSALQLVMLSDDFIALRRRQWLQFILARRDMFSDEEQWQRFGDLVNEKLASS
jgi:hypothetical protein